MPGGLLGDIATTLESPISNTLILDDGSSANITYMSGTANLGEAANDALSLLIRVDFGNNVGFYVMAFSNLEANEFEATIWQIVRGVSLSQGATSVSSSNLCQTSPVDMSSFETFREPESGFTLTYPQGWTAEISSPTLQLHNDSELFQQLDFSDLDNFPAGLVSMSAGTFLYRTETPDEEAEIQLGDRNGLCIVGKYEQTELTYLFVLIYPSETHGHADYEMEFVAIGHRQDLERYKSILLAIAGSMRISSEETPATDTVSAVQQTWCNDTLPSYLSVDLRGQVANVEGGTVRLRSGPGTNNSIVLEMDAGTPFTVIGGPECGNYTWWQLQLADGTIGWAAEGIDSDYFLEPYRETVESQLAQEIIGRWDVFTPENSNDDGYRLGSITFESSGEMHRTFLGPQSENGSYRFVGQNQIEIETTFSVECYDFPGCGTKRQSYILTVAISGDEMTLSSATGSVTYYQRKSPTPTTSNPNILGIWESEDHNAHINYFGFYSDGTVVPVINEGDLRGTYTLLSDSQLRLDLTLTYTDLSSTVSRDYEFTLAGDTLTLVGELASTNPYRRIHRFVQNELSPCPDAPVSRMTVGFGGQVSIENDAVTRLRSEPSSQATLVARIQPGWRFNVIGGPECNEGFAWWNVEISTTGERGWMAEANQDEYFIEPLPQPFDEIPNVAIALPLSCTIDVASGDVHDLIDAINLANTEPSADMICLESGVYDIPQPIISEEQLDGEVPDDVLNGLPLISSTIAIVGVEAENTIITGEEEITRIFEVAQTGRLTLRNITIQNGSADAPGGGGGGILNYGYLEVINIAIVNNIADFGGGGIYNAGGTVVITESTISNNSVQFNGGGIYNENGIVNLTASVISENSTGNGFSGGALANTEGVVSITNSCIVNNSLPSIYNATGSPQIDATNNWWGTTDPRSNSVILGDVSFTPVSTQNDCGTTTDQVEETCNLSYVVDNSQANGVVSGSMAGSSPCDAILEITNKRGYWVNLEIRHNQRLDIEPVGGELNLYATFGVLAPFETVEYSVHFTGPAQWVIAKLDVTALSGQGARIMNIVKAVVDALSITFPQLPISAVETILLEQYPDVITAFGRMPNLAYAAQVLFQVPPDIHAFRRAIINANDAGEFQRLGELFNEIGLEDTYEALQQVLEDGRILGIIDVIVNNFTNAIILLMGEPAGFVEFRTQGN